MECLDFTSVTLDEFQQLVPPFEAAFQGRMAAWRMDGKPRTARRLTVYQNCPLPPPEDRLLFILVDLKTYALQVVQGRLLDGSGQSESMASRPLARAAGGTPCPRRCPGPLCDRPRPAARRRGSRRRPRGRPAGGGASPRGRCSSRRAGVPPFAHDGTERRIVRPQDAAAQTDCYSGKKKDHTVKNVLLVNAPLTILFLSDTHGGRVQEKRMAEATPTPLPAGSRLLQDLGFLAFTLPQVEIYRPTKNPRGQELPLEQQGANQALHPRRLRIEHVNSSVKRCRLVKDRSRFWKDGVRDLVMEICCALHNFRVRLTPWQPMV